MMTCSSLGLEYDPIVAGACHDLILCCATETLQSDYFICNPYTAQWVALPPSRIFPHQVPVGFICDPYWTSGRPSEEHTSSKCITIDNGRGHVGTLNPEYRCHVERLMPSDDTTLLDQPFSKIKVGIFSFELGEWREAIVSFPREFRYDSINSKIHFAHNGMLYWLGVTNTNFLIGIDPSNDDITNNIHEPHYEGRFIELLANELLVERAISRRFMYKYGGRGHFQMQGLVVSGCLQICVLDKLYSHALTWELKHEEEDVIVTGDGVGKLFSRKERLELYGKLMNFDPADKGILCVDCEKFDVRTGNSLGQLKWLADLPSFGRNNRYFFPSTTDMEWPTPVPRLSPGLRRGKANRGFF